MRSRGPAYAGPLPDGGHFVAESGSIMGSSGALAINQTSARGVIDWNSSSIRSGNRLAFNNVSRATPNRVTGGDMSSILATLTATGSVHWVNPQHIVVGSTGVTTARSETAKMLRTSHANRLLFHASHPCYACRCVVDDSAWTRFN